MAGGAISTGAGTSYIGYVHGLHCTKCCEILCDWFHAVLRAYLFAALMSHDGFYTAVLELSSVNCGTKGAHRLHCTSNSLTRFKGSDQRAPRSGGIRSTERVLRDIARVYFVRTAHPFDATPPGGVRWFRQSVAMSSKFSFLWHSLSLHASPCALRRPPTARAVARAPVLLQGPLCDHALLSSALRRDAAR